VPSSSWSTCSTSSACGRAACRPPRHAPAACGPRRRHCRDDALNDALLRWIGLDRAIGILGLVPGLEGYIRLIGGIWLLVLLVSTGTIILHQGLH
jgi:hypothetical protein